MDAGRTRICALPGKLTVISGGVKDPTCARGAVETFGGGGTQGASKNKNGPTVALGAGVRDLRVGCAIELRDVVIKAAKRHVHLPWCCATKATHGGEARVRSSKRFRERNAEDTGNIIDRRRLYTSAIHLARAGLRVEN